MRKSTVNPRVAEHKSWSKFGFEKGKAAGPGSETTSIGENIIFNPSVTFKKDGKEEKKEQESGVADLKAQLKDKKVKCRICDGDHFTARCPFKDTMAPVGEDGDIGPSKGAAGIATALDDDDEGPGVAGKLGSGGGGGYVPPHLRKGGAATTGERMGGKYEKDDLATLRVTNVSESAEENELRDIFERFGRVTRVFLARDKETGRAKGFAFISYQERTDAARACEKLDGCEFIPKSISLPPLHLLPLRKWERCTEILTGGSRWVPASHPKGGVCEENNLRRNLGALAHG